MHGRNLVWGTAFIGANALDWLLTRLLIYPGSHAYEMNPIASGVLSACGWSGLAWFKATCAGVVLGAGTIIGRRNPTTARRLLGFGCGVLLIVVCYSTYLLSLTAALPRSWPPPKEQTGPAALRPAVSADSAEKPQSH